MPNITDYDLLAHQHAFQKRHICIHAGGEFADRYVKMIPEDPQLLGSQVVLTVEELDTAAIATRIALGELVKSVERPG